MNAPAAVSDGRRELKPLPCGLELMGLAAPPDFTLCHPEQSVTSHKEENE